MDSLIIYLIIGVVWIFQLLAKKREEPQNTRAQERQDTGAPAQDVGADPCGRPFVGALLAAPSEGRASPAPTEEGERMGSPLQITPPVETAQAEHGFSVSDLSDDVFEQGIILSAILGPPRSAVYLQQAYRQR